MTAPVPGMGENYGRNTGVSEFDTGFNSIIDKVLQAEILDILRFAIMFTGGDKAGITVNFL